MELLLKKSMALKEERRFEAVILIKIITMEKFLTVQLNSYSTSFNGRKTSL